METKQCSKCGKTKSLEKGTWRWSIAIGCFGGICLSCFREVGGAARRKFAATEHGKISVKQANLKSSTKVRATPEGLAKSRAANLVWAKNNRGKATSIVKRYRANKDRRMPVWADRAKIEQVYQCAQNLSKSSGVEQCVDHIVPLAGRLVSGLHVDANLQILTRPENSRKSNNFDPITSGFSFLEIKALFSEFDMQVANGR